MFIAMYQHKGIGLAANQVGVLKQVIVLNTRYNPTILVNPVIHHTENELVSEPESCLSIPGYCRTIERPENIYIKSLNRYGKEQNFEANGLLARCIQHECDHLQGVLINSIKGGENEE
jgi:peptide deformylase